MPPFFTNPTTYMFKPELFMLMFAIMAPVMAVEVEYARVVQETEQGYRLHPDAVSADFSAAFADFAPQRDGEKSDAATFGAPRWLAVRIDGKTYIIQVDNNYGVFTLHRAVHKGKRWERTRGSRTIYHPALYDNLRAAGLRIHTAEELKSMSKQERKQALSGSDSPILAPL